MVLLDNSVVYNETREILLGKRKQNPLLIEFSDWFKSRYSIDVLNIHFDKVVQRKRDRFRLKVFFECTEDYQKMFVSPFRPNQKYDEEIVLEFRILAINHRLADISELEDLFVCYVDFSDEAKTVANWNADKEVKKEIKSKYPVVWDVVWMFSSSVVFYYSDADIRVYEKNGTSKAITDLYYYILKKYDEPNYFTRENIRLKFDSKENLDKNYQGNLFYYTR